MVFQDAVQRPVQNPAGETLQICADSQRSKTWGNRIHCQKRKKKHLACKHQNSGNVLKTGNIH